MLCMVLNSALVKRAAAAAVCDPRTVRRALRGELIAGRVGERVRVALAALGIELTPTGDAETDYQSVSHGANPTEPLDPGEGVSPSRVTEASHAR